MNPATRRAMSVPSYSPEAQAALLKATNRVFELGLAVESLDDLIDGMMLGHILHQLDPEFDPSHLEDDKGPAGMGFSSTRNIQIIYKGLFRFIRKEVPDLSCQAKKFDFQAIAENPEPQGISQLLAVMICVAVLGPKGPQYIPKIMGKLDPPSQAHIKDIINVAQQDMCDSKYDDELDQSVETVLESRDMDLLVEEQNAALRHELEITKKNLSDYITRLEYLMQSHEELRAEKERSDRELDVMRKATQDGANNAESIRLLEAQVNEQMEIIARYEEVIRGHEKAKAQLESDVQKLTHKSTLCEELQDQVSEWKHKAEDLEKKANTAERYKQKLESQQHLVKELQNLQYEKSELQDQLRSLMEDSARHASIKKSEEELTKMITQSEQSLWDERNHKASLMRDVSALEEELIRLKAQRAHDESFIQDLQDQIQHGGGAIVKNEKFIDTETIALSLEDELNNASDDEDMHLNMPLQLSRLKAENDLLRRTMGSTGDAALLRRELEGEKQQKELLQQKHNETFERLVLAQSQIEALMNNMTGEGTQAFQTLRARNLQLEANAEKDEKRIDVLENQTADQTRELHTTKTLLSASNKDNVTALKDLNTTDKLVAASLQSELEKLREKYNFVTSERDAHKSQLIEALLAKEQLRKYVEEGKDLQDSTNVPQSADSPKKDSEKVEKLRSRLKERNEQLEKSEQERIDLQKKLKAALGGETAAAQKAASEQFIKNILKENALLTTAWYFVASHLQSDHVTLQRRQVVPPKSWINKQRQMVNGQLRRRDSLYLY